MTPRSLSVCAVLSLLVLAGAPLSATSYVMVSDEALVETAPVAAVVRIVSVDREAGLRNGTPVATEYVVRIERALKGQVPGGASATAVVRVPGGVGPGGMSLKINGAPRFVAGERALLFLEPRSGANGGTYHVMHLLLGAFHEVQAAGHTLAVRDLAEARELRHTADGIQEGAGVDRLRDFDAFADWVAERASGRSSGDEARTSAAKADYFVQEEGIRQAISPFWLFEDSEDGYNLRWFNFDTAGQVNWSAYNKAQTGLTGGGYAQFQAALQDWNAESQTPINYQYSGKTSNKNGLVTYDEVNTIVFNDPNGELPSFSCSTGGVLAYGGPWYYNSTASYNGNLYHGIANADVVINDGLGCFFSSSPNGSKAAEELFAHELGHTLGLNHPCGDTGGPDPGCDNPVFDDALMRAYIHDDARGGRLNSDDQAGIRVLYGNGVTVPAAPSALTAVPVSTTEIQLTWKDNATNETNYRVEVKELTGNYAEVLSVPANSVGAVVAGLSPATGYVFRVHAFNAAGFSAYSSEATASTNAPIGPCVADSHTLCLNSGRFRVSVAWKTGTGDTGQGSVVPVTANDSGLLWFFDENNWEMLVKVLDGCSLTDHYWVFFAATTDVQFVLTVSDSQTGLTKTYLNPLGRSADAVTDTSALDSCL